MYYLNFKTTDSVFYAVISNSHGFCMGIACIFKCCAFCMRITYHVITHIVMAHVNDTEWCKASVWEV